MRFVADESVDAGIVRALRVDDFEVFSIAESCPGISDNGVLSLSVERGSVLITEDRDFGELIFRERREHLGVLFVRLGDFLPATKVKIFISIFKAHASLVSDNFCVISPGNFRIRRVLF